MLDSKGARRIAPAAIAHASVLLGLYFALKGWGYWLDRYLLLYGDNGVVVGASFTDVHVQLPILWGLIVLCCRSRDCLLRQYTQADLPMPLISLALVFGIAVVIGPVFTALYQRVYVKPNELQIETPYIARNIALTREAYKLKNVVKPFTAEQRSVSIAAEQPFDDRQYQIMGLAAAARRLCAAAGNQDLLQISRRGYRSLHIGRHLPASYDLRARARISTLLSGNAQTWVNLHVLFTHGNGVVMSPVTQNPRPKDFPYSICRIFRQSYRAVRP